MMHSLLPGTHSLRLDDTSSMAPVQTTAEYLAHTETYVESLCQNLDNRSASGQPADLHLQVTSLRALQQHIRLWYAEVSGIPVLGHSSQNPPSNEQSVLNSSIKRAILDNSIMCTYFYHK